MDRAFDVAAQVLRSRLKDERPADDQVLSTIENGEVVEVTGAHDHMDRVLRATGVPFTSVSPDSLERVDWDRMLVLLINCPGQLSAAALDRLVVWVRAGGQLLTTDWALVHVLERAFPGRVRHNGQSVPDCVVAVQQVAESSLLDGFLGDDREPKWWIESASYPCEVVDREHVRVLVSSYEMESGWGAPAVVVEWDEGEGRVVHLVSHLYLQRSETRGQKDRVLAKQYLEELGMNRGDVDRLSMNAMDLTAAELKSAQTTTGMAYELMLDAKRQQGRRGK